MHFEVPKSKKFKEFGGEYVMIVISILTALGLEQGFETLHHRHLAHEASEKMDVELRDNLKELKLVLEHNEAKRKAMADVRDQLLAGIRDKTSDEEMMRRIETWRPALGLSIQSPSLSREAWETSVANQAVTWLPRDKLETYASAYVAIGDTNTFIRNGAMRFLDAGQMIDTSSDLRMGVAKPQQVFRTVNQMLSVYENVDNNLKALEGGLQKIMGEPGDGQAGKPAH